MESFIEDPKNFSYDKNVSNFLNSEKIAEIEDKAPLLAQFLKTSHENKKEFVLLNLKLVKFSKNSAALSFFCFCFSLFVTAFFLKIVWNGFKC